MDYRMKTALFFLRKNGFVIVLLTLQAILVFAVFGKVANYIQLKTSDYQVVDNALLGKNYFLVRENMNDTTYQRFMQDGYYFDRLRTYMTRLNSNTEFFYTSFGQQPITLNSHRVPVVCVEGYDEGVYDSASMTVNGSNTIRALQVSPGIIKAFSVSFAEGGDWEASIMNGLDYMSEPIPIIVGNSYAGLFQIGEIVDGEYLFEDVRFVVIGVLEKDALFTTGITVEAFDRYVLIPTVFSEASEGTVFNRMRIIQSANGTMIATEEYQTIRSIYKDILEDCALPKTEFLLVDAREASDLDQFTAASVKIMAQHSWILGGCLFFLVVSLSVSVAAIVRAHAYEFSVYLLNGASVVDLFMSVLILLMGVIFFADAIAAIILALEGVSLPIWGHLLALVIVLLSSLYPYFALKRSVTSNLEDRNSADW